MALKQFVVVKYVDFPGVLKKTIIEYYEGVISIANGVYVTYDTWGWVWEALTPEGQLVEQWLETNVPELQGRRERSQENEPEVLIHFSW